MAPVAPPRWGRFFELEHSSLRWRLQLSLQPTARFD
jgi:hypothetical protein